MIIDILKEFLGPGTGMDRKVTKSPPTARYTCRPHRPSPLLGSLTGLLPIDIGKRYNLSLLTPRDWASHFKNVLHRAMKVNSQDASKACRCCYQGRENLQHFAACPIVGRVFDDLAKLVAHLGRSGQSSGEAAGDPDARADLSEFADFTVTERERFCLFALTPKGGPLHAGWINLHLLLWKQIIYQLTCVTLEDASFHPHEIWQAAWTRLNSKALAKQEHLRTARLRAESRGKDMPSSDRYARPLRPLATFDEHGKLEWNPNIYETIRRLSQTPA